jgi:hypothetical protein
MQWDRLEPGLSGFAAAGIGGIGGIDVSCC